MSELLQKNIIDELLDLHDLLFRKGKANKKQHKQYEKLKTEAKKMVTEYPQVQEHDLVLRSRIADRVMEIHRLSDVVKGLSERKGHCEVCGKQVIALCSKKCSEFLTECERAHSTDVTSCQEESNV